MTDAIRKAIAAFEATCKCWHMGDEAEADAAVSRAREELEQAIAGVGVVPDAKLGPRALAGLLPLDVGVKGPDHG